MTNGPRTTLHDTRVQREIEHGKQHVAALQPDAGWSSPAGKIRRKRRIAFLTQNLPADAHVLEVGAGTGLQTADLLGVLHDVTAIDISKELLALAQTRAPAASYHVMDAHAPTFPDASFDAILGVSILHHLDWAVALGNYLRLLKPGGRIRFSEPNLLNPQIFLQKNIPFLKRLSGDSPDEYAFTRRHITLLLHDLGFVDVHVRPYEFLHPSTPEWLIPTIVRMEDVLSRTPLQEFAGSLLIEAKKAPESRASSI